MQTTKTTSRNAALDYLLSIGNLIALADHKEEQIMNLLEEHDNVPSLENISEDEIKTLQENIRLEIVQTSKERDELYKLRKELQRNFFDTYNIDQDYWCQFKHYAVALISAEECRNAHTSFQLDTVVTKLRKLVYQFLWIAMGVWPANCGRCLADAVEEKIQSKWKLTLPELPEEYKWPFKCLHDDGTWWIRVYKVMNPTQQDLGNWLQVEQIWESDWVCCKDLKPSTIQISLDEATAIDADIIKPTPIEYAFINNDSCSDT